ncbi:hypothetical protein KCU88_g2543, partial [Aureobasidium melanogenum]
MKTVIYIYKPVRLVADLSGCTDMGDLVASIKAVHPTVLEENDGLEYFPSGCQALASKQLTGPYHWPESPLPYLPGPQLDIMTFPKSVYDINVCACGSGECSRDKHFAVSLSANCQISHLKQGVGSKLGAPASDQVIKYNGRTMDDSAYLFQEGIFENSTVAVTINAKISLSWKNNWHSMVVPLDAEFSSLLGAFARQEWADLSNLCFQFDRTSWQFSGRAKDWVEDRNRIYLFKAEQVVGTVKENGLATGDRIRVYQMIPKRERETPDEGDLLTNENPQRKAKKPKGRAARS